MSFGYISKIKTSHTEWLVKTIFTTKCYIYRLLPANFIILQDQFLKILICVIDFNNRQLTTHQWIFLSEKVGFKGGLLPSDGETNLSYFCLYLWFIDSEISQQKSARPLA